MMLALGTCGPSSNPEPRPPEPDAAVFEALPYLSWTEGETDPQQRGVTVWDRERAWEGINLFTNDVNEVYLMDMAGRRLHIWTLPKEFEHCEHFELLPRGEVVVVCVLEGLVKLDRDSNVLWVSEMPVHHDVEVLADGTFLTPRRVGSQMYQGRRVIFDGVAHLSAEGQALDVWSTWEHLAELQEHHEPTSLDKPSASPRSRKIFDYYHLNTVEVLPATLLGERDTRFQAGNLLICLRNANLILILDRDTKGISWSWGPGELSLPHMPTMLASGNILVFDNGFAAQRSRVLELDPVSLEIVWRYEGDPPESFFTKYRGSNQRLPNGNTLICDADNGRVVEVTAAGELVWEFWNPELKGGSRKRIYRFMRKSKDEVDDLFREKGPSVSVYSGGNGGHEVGLAPVQDTTERTG